MPLIFLPWWFLRARFFGIKRPLQTVLFISDQCNLSCEHCSIYQIHYPHIKSYKKIKEELEYSYCLGSRFVDFEGGEPTLWKDGDFRLNDLIRLAKRIGFYSTTVTTNAQIPFSDLEADSIWISLDGIGTFHDEIRGEGAFNRLLQNINQSNHKKLNANMVVNAKNCESVERTIEFVASHPKIQSISINFHTPYLGTEQLFLDWNKRGEIIDLIINKKKKGYPIMNSISGIKLMKQSSFKKYCWISNFILSDGNKISECQGKSVGICHSCGFSMSGEMNAIFRLKLDTVWAAIKLRI